MMARRPITLMGSPDNRLSSSNSANAVSFINTRSRFSNPCGFGPGLFFSSHGYKVSDSEQIVNRYFSKCWRLDKLYKFAHGFPVGPKSEIEKGISQGHAIEVATKRVRRPSAKFPRIFFCPFFLLLPSEIKVWFWAGITGAGRIRSSLAQDPEPAEKSNSFMQNFFAGRFSNPKVDFKFSRFCASGSPRIRLFASTVESMRA